jgi:hypothetical protein
MLFIKVCLELFFCIKCLTATIKGAVVSYYIIVQTCRRNNRSIKLTFGPWVTLTPKLKLLTLRLLTPTLRLRLRLLRLRLLRLVLSTLRLKPLRWLRPRLWLNLRGLVRGPRHRAENLCRCYFSRVSRVSRVMTEQILNVHWTIRRVGGNRIAMVK